MADWHELVRERFSTLALDKAEKEEVCAELAAHLEETYEGFRKQGFHEKEAALRSLEQVSDWQDLQRKIFAAKRRERPMKKRVQQMWIPGFLTLILSTLFFATVQKVILSTLFLATLQKVGFLLRIVGSVPNAILFYVPWLAGLPFFGALGAYLSSRAGGSRGTMVFASVFPVLALTTAFLLMFPIGFIIELVTGKSVDFGFVATALLKDGVGWLLLPGAALFAGGLLVHLLFSRRSSPQDTAIV